MIQTAQIEIKSDSMVSTQQAKYTPLTQNGQTIVSLDTPTVQQIQLKQNELEDELIELNELMNEKEKIIVNASFKPYHNSPIIEPASEPETDHENEKKGHVNRYNKKKKSEKPIVRGK